MRTIDEIENEIEYENDRAADLEIQADTHRMTVCQLEEELAEAQEWAEEQAYTESRWAEEEALDDGYRADDMNRTLGDIASGLRGLKL